MPSTPQIRPHSISNVRPRPAQHTFPHMLPAVRGVCCRQPRVSLSLRVHELKPSHRLRGLLPLHSLLPAAEQQRRVLVTRTFRGRCDTASTNTVAAPLILTSRPSSTLLLLPAMSATKVQQQRGHAGHSHGGHHHHHDNTYLTSTNKNDAGVRITRIGLYVNLCMAISKGIGGYVFHSQGTPTTHPVNDHA
jgi:hypothetical protein